MAANDKREEGGRNLDARRARLGAEIERKLSEEKNKSPDRSDLERAGDDYAKSPAALGFRLSADFLSAVLVGGALGLGLDKIAGISPFGLIVFLLLGFAAGVLNALRILKGQPKFAGKWKKRGAGGEKQG